MLASVGAFLLLGEDISAPGVAGLLLVVAGITLIATQGRFAAFRTAEAHRGVRWGMGTGALIATYTVVDGWAVKRSEEHTSELQSLMRISYAVFWLNKKKPKTNN